MIGLAANIVEDRRALVAALHTRGVCYLAPTPTGDEPAMSDEALLAGLAASRDARLRYSIAALLLRSPALAEVAAGMVEDPGTVLSQPARDELRRQYLAAMYLQRMWRTRLVRAFGPSPQIPERFVADAGLPAADLMNGEFGLAALTDDHEYNEWSSFDQAVDLLCEQPCAPQQTRDLDGLSHVIHLP